jgi:hypothetical protein
MVMSLPSYSSDINKELRRMEHEASLNSCPKRSAFRLQALGQIGGALFMNRTRRFFVDGEVEVEVYSGNREASLNLEQKAPVSLPQSVPYRSA